jgi:hypothetical protein
VARSETTGFRDSDIVKPLPNPLPKSVVQSALISGTRPPQKLRKPAGVAVLVKIDRADKSCPIPYGLMTIPLWNN